MSTVDFLKNIGLTNTDTEDLGDLIGFERKIVRQTFCSSYSCQGYSHKPRFVAESHIEKCPYCKNPNHLLYKTTSIKLPEMNGKND